MLSISRTHMLYETTTKLDLSLYSLFCDTVLLVFWWMSPFVMLGLVSSVSRSVAERKFPKWPVLSVKLSQSVICFVFLCRSDFWPRVVCFIADKVRCSAGTHPNYRQHSFLSCNKQERGRWEPGCCTGVLCLFWFFVAAFDALLSLPYW